MKSSDMYMPVVIDYESWCDKLPEWWVENCGCKRTCELSNGLGNTLFKKHSFYIKHLLRYKWVSIEGWIVRMLNKNEVALYPWPKNLVKKLKFVR